MRIILPNVLKNSAIYGIVTVLQKGVGFVLLPLYTTLLTPADYGILNIVTSLSTFVSIFIMLGLTGAASRFHYKNQDEGYRKSLWGTLTLFVLLSSVVVGSVVIIFHGFFIDPFLGNIPFFPYLFIGLLNTILTPLYMFYQTYLQTIQNGKKYGLNSLSNFLVNTGLILLFLYVHNKGAMSVLLANLLTSFVFLIYVMFSYIPKIKLTFNKPILDQSFKYSLPLLPHLLSNACAGTIDRLLINGLRNESEAGFYSVANQFGYIIHTTVFSVQAAYSPWFFQKYAEGVRASYRKIENAGFLCCLCYALIALLISLFSPEILRFMVSNQFQHIWIIIPFVSFAFVFNGLYCIFSTVLFLKDTQYIFIISVSAMIVNVTLNLILIPIYGFVGGAFACLCSYFIKSVISVVLSRIRVKTVCYPWMKMFGITLLFFAITFVNHLLIDLDWFYSLAIKVAVVIGILLPMLLLNFRKMKVFLADLERK